MVFIQQDFKAFHQSIASELNVKKDRIRQLIGNRHWLTDGEYKEFLLREILKERLPESFDIGTGFVCYPNIKNKGSDNISSNQLDILITDKNYPSLLKLGKLKFVTTSCVKSIIEVKTKLYKNRSSNNVKDVLNKLSDQIENIRENSNKKKPIWAGLFVFEYNPRIDEQYFLEILQNITEEKIHRVINCIAFGNHIFIRFWKEGRHIGSPIKGPVWHLYNLDSLAPAYFVSNLVLELSNRMENDLRAWLPENTKEVFRIAVKSLMNKYNNIHNNNFTFFTYKPNSENTFKFRFINLRNGIEIDILEMPKYGKRPKDNYITHRKVTSRDCKKISWSGIIRDEEAAKNIAIDWAEKTCKYIATGEKF